MDPSDRIKASLRNIYSLVQCFFILLFPRKHGKNFHDDVFIYMTFAGWWTFSFRWTLYGEPVKSGLSGLKYSIFTHFFFIQIIFSIIEFGKWVSLSEWWVSWRTWTRARMELSPFECFPRLKYDFISWWCFMYGF